MTHSNTSGSDKSNISPVMLQLAEKQKQLEARLEEIRSKLTPEERAEKEAQDRIEAECLEKEWEEEERQFEAELREQERQEMRAGKKLKAAQKKYVVEPNAFNRFNPAPNKLELLRVLNTIPEDVTLIPVIDKKACFIRDPKIAGKRKNWNHIKAGADNRQEVRDYLTGKSALKAAVEEGQSTYDSDELYTNYASGFAMKSGDDSGRIVALDQDGESAAKWLEALSQGDLPKTVAFTSGKAGRQQLLYKVSPELAARLENFTVRNVREIDDLPDRIVAKVAKAHFKGFKSESERQQELEQGIFNTAYQCKKGEDGNYCEALEVRYNNKYSVLPPSRHPSTGSYSWINSFEDCAIADAPEWLVDLLEAIADDLQNNPKNTHKLIDNSELSRKIEERRKSGGLKGEYTDINEALAATLDILSYEGVFNWAGHEWAQERSEWIHGSCPRHESTSGTSFAINPYTGGWMCHSCNDASGNIVGYRSWRETGDAHPKGAEWLKYATELFNEAGITLKRSNGFAKKLHGELSKEEYQQRNLKPELTEAEKLDKVIDLQQAQAAKDVRKDKELADYLARLAIDHKRVTKFYECNERYLSDKTFEQFPTIAECEARGQMLALKAPKGVGKSYRIKEYIKLADKACWLTVSVTIRRNLGMAQAYEWKIKWVDEDGMESFFQGNSNTMSCCWDSLHKFHKADYRNKPILLIVDEAESGLDHMVTAETIKHRGNRVDIYAELRRIVSHINTNGGLVIAADADLSNDSVEYFHTIGNQFPVTVIHNSYVDVKKQITVYYGKEGEVRNAIRDAIETGVPFLVATDSIKELQKLHGYAEEFMNEIELPEQLDKLWLIDGETSGTDENRERLRDINSAIKKQNPIAIFYTPSINVGVSIDVQYFCEGFAIFKGSITADSARQMIARNREIIPWTIFADNISKKNLLSSDTPITPQPIKNRLLEELEDQVALTNHISQKLLSEGQEQDSESIALARLELARQLKYEKASLDTAEFHLLANITAKKNFQYKYYHDCFVAGMRADGWTVTTKKGNKTAFCDELKEIREKQMKKESEAIATADHTKIPDYETAKSILSTENDRELRSAAYKVCVGHWTGVEMDKVDAALVEIIKFNPRWLAGVKFQHYLENEDVVREIDARKINKMAKDYAKHKLTAANDYKGNSPVVAAIKEFGLLNVIDIHDDEQTFRKEDFDPLLKKFKNYGTTRLINYFKKFGITLTNRYVFTDPIRLIVKPMLAKMNFSIQVAKKDASGQKHYRIPAEEINCLKRAIVLEGLLKKRAEIQSQRELQLAAVTEVILEENHLSPVLELASNEQVTA